MQDRTCASTSKAPTRRECRAQRHATRAVLRARYTETRAGRQLVTDTPQLVKTHLVTHGIDQATAERIADTFSPGAELTATDTTVIKSRGRTRRRVPVKPYDEAAFTAYFAPDRPCDPQAAALFTQAALAVAA